MMSAQWRKERLNEDVYCSILVTNLISVRPTTTVTGLTMLTELTVTTPITFAGGQCVPRCLQSDEF